MLNNKRLLTVAALLMATIGQVFGALPRQKRPQQPPTEAGLAVTGEFGEPAARTGYSTPRVARPQQPAVGEGGEPLYSGEEREPRGRGRVSVEEESYLVSRPAAELTKAERLAQARAEVAAFPISPLGKELLVALFMHIANNDLPEREIEASAQTFVDNFLKKNFKRGANNALLGSAVRQAPGLARSFINFGKAQASEDSFIAVMAFLIAQRIINFIAQGTGYVGATQGAVARSLQKQLDAAKAAVAARAGGERQAKDDVIGEELEGRLRALRYEGPKERVDEPELLGGSTRLTPSQRYRKGYSS